MIAGTGGFRVQAHEIRRARRSSVRFGAVTAYALPVQVEAFGQAEWLFDGNVTFWIGFDPMTIRSPVGGRVQRHPV
jgi:hypothetical protein